MFSITSTFTAAAGGTGSASFWMLVLAIAIINDSDRRAKERREKRSAPGTPLRPTVFGR